MKVPTKHGLDRKFKPWRKGKSTKSNKRSSLKQQLRGHERLLAKILESAQKDPDNQKVDEEKTKDLRSKITVLKEEISQKQQSMVEKKHAEKAHGQRFLDRQRLVRSEKKVRKSTSKDKEKELLKIAMDQVYVAHHPNDVKYMPLFKNGKRVIDQSRQLFRRAVTRKRILRNINTTTKVNWISDDQYKLLPKNEWTIQDEERVFGGSISRSTKDHTKSLKAEDSRFELASNHTALLEAAKKAETDLSLNKQDEKKIANNIASSNKEEMKNDSSSSSSDSSSDSEEVDPLSSKTSRKSDSKDGRQIPSANETKMKRKKNNDDTSSSSYSDSSTSDDSDGENDEIKPSPSITKNAKQKNESDSSSSDSDSNSDSDSDTDSSDTDSSDAEENTKSSSRGNPQAITTTPTEEEEEIDDFLIDATDSHDVFNKPAVRIPALSTFRGDKSKGFETQSQRPGEYKKKRLRRF